ncbi:MAG: FCD domain-containing protein [Lactimicrobium massiliense]|nr:FCD domain-containing protein [Lactimicrobium massiliense]
MRQCCNACADDIHNGSPYLQADIAFHSAIVEAAHNAVLVRITPMIHEGMGVFIDYQNHDQIGMTLQSHEAVYQAVEAKIRMRLKRQ